MTHAREHDNVGNDRSGLHAGRDSKVSRSAIPRACTCGFVSRPARVTPRRVSRIKTRRELLAIVGTLALAGACGGQPAPPPASTAAASTASASPEAPPEPKQASAATTAQPAAPAESSSSSPPSTSATAPPPAPPKIELPRGGRQLFPEHRLVGFCGTPGGPALGRLLGDLPAKSKQLLSYADKYAPTQDRKILPVYELIAVVVQGAAGADGKWRRRVPDSVVDEYLQIARVGKGILLLNLQPGHSDFLTEAKHFDKFLRMPDVGLALDPEWAMKGKQKPGVIMGQTSGAEINSVADYLAGLVKAGDLPEKALVYHQVNGRVVKDEAEIVAHPGVALIQSVDGLGPQASKIKTYNFLVKTKPAVVHSGFKLFFDEDKTNGGKLMTPTEVLALTPVPEYVMYE